MQEKLYNAAKADPKRRFHSLGDKVWRLDFLEQAWKDVKANKGAAGIDGISIRDIKKDGEEEFLLELQEELRNGTYRVKPIKRVYIPKKGKKGEMRPLGIPTVKDRVVQGALKLVLETIFEADFKDCSYGFRPDRSAEDARRAIYKWLNFGLENIIECDIVGFFDNIPHEGLMDEIECRISDGWVLKLLRAILRAPIIDDGKKIKPKKGTPQGGVISPLLANIYLNQLDREWDSSGMTKRYWHNAQLVRYADDFVILTSRSPEEPMAKVKDIMSELGLELHPGKTRVVMAEEGFDFLGFHFVRRYSRKWGMRRTFTFPSHDSMNHAREEIRRLTDKRQVGWMKVPDIIERVNRFIRGWAEYYKHTNASKAFNKMQCYANQRVRKYLRYRRQKSGFGYKEYPDRRLYDEFGLHCICTGTIQHQSRNAALRSPPVSLLRENLTMGSTGGRWTQ